MTSGTFNLYSSIWNPSIHTSIHCGLWMTVTKYPHFKHSDFFNNFSLLFSFNSFQLTRHFHIMLYLINHIYLLSNTHRLIQSKHQIQPTTCPPITNNVTLCELRIESVRWKGEKWFWHNFLSLSDWWRKEMCAKTILNSLFTAPHSPCAGEHFNFNVFHFLFFASG